MNDHPGGQEINILCVRSRGGSVCVVKVCVGPIRYYEIMKQYSASAALHARDDSSSSVLWRRGGNGGGGGGGGALMGSPWGPAHRLNVRLASPPPCRSRRRNANI